VFTSPLHRNDSSSIVACVYISAETCLPPLPSNELIRLSGVMSHYEMPLVTPISSDISVRCLLQESVRCAEKRRSSATVESLYTVSSIKRSVYYFSTTPRGAKVVNSREEM
jgi:hypothetical protein